MCRYEVDPSLFLTAGQQEENLPSNHPDALKRPVLLKWIDFHFVKKEK